MQFNAISVGIDPPNAAAVIKRDLSGKVTVEARSCLKGHSPLELALWAATQVKAAHSMGAVCDVAIEGPGGLYPGLRFDTLWSIGKGAGYWIGIFELSTGISPLIVSPAAFRANIGLKARRRDAIKAESIAYISARYPELGAKWRSQKKRRSTIDDEAEAVCLALMGAAGRVGY